MHKAPPSKCHMSLVELMNKGFLKHIISQNIDGLHLKSGIEEEKISELHGNQNIEICEKCKK
jgi:mono-ADP-ribosyltransferase sirtuin 6